MNFEITTTYYDRKSRKEVRFVHGTIAAENVDAAHSEGVRLFGLAGANLLGESSEFWQARAIKVKSVS